MQVLWTAIELLISLSFALTAVWAFNYYAFAHKRFNPKLFKTWFKIVVLIIPFFFICNAIAESGHSFFLDFGDKYQSLPAYLNLFATLITAYLLYRTLTTQNRANQKASFENRFFKFINFHRENVNVLRYRDPKDAGTKYRERNEVFTIIYYEIRDLLKEVMQKRHVTTISDKAEAISLAYQCVFYGAGEDGQTVLRKQFSKKCFQGIDFWKRKAAYFDSKAGGVYYSGHVRRLGHYFRNIYQAIKYVDDQDFLTEKEKYSYIAHFRAQMSVYEQLIFFFNSLSRQGQVWEWEKYSKPIFVKAEHDLKNLFRSLWVTKYDLIRNSLNDEGNIIKGISIKEFYPLLTLQYEEEIAVSGILPFVDNRKSICRFCFNEKYIGYKDEKIIEKVELAYEKNRNSFDKFKCDETSCLTKRVLSSIENRQSIE
jgi:hypothetical protein